MSFATMANSRGSEIKRKLKSNTTSQLEVESRRMEERLRMLKQMMSAEKARREVEGGFLWQSGQKGPLLRRHQDQTTSNIKTTVAGSNSGQRKNKEKVRVKILTDKNEPDSNISDSVRCGQCDKSTASLNCVECLENYCQLCYAKFHHKGALASHHAKPVSSKLKSQKTSPQKTATAVNTVEVSSKAASQAVETNYSEQSHSPKRIENSLLDGTYNEEESAASFQQALAEWRGQAVQINNEAQAYTTKDSETATVSSAGMQAGEVEVRKWNSRPQIQFSGKSGVTYFEQLMMKRHRYDPMFLSKANSKQSAKASNEVDSVDDRDLPFDEDTPSEYNIFYSPELHVVESPQKSTMDDISSYAIPSVQAASGVEIVEVDIGGPVTSATPNAVTIRPNQLIEQEQSNPVKVHTKSSKSDNTRRPRSVNKKQACIEKSKSKTTSIPPRVVVPHHCPSRPLSVASVVSDSDIEASVKKAWTQCSAQPQLTQFFLQGVEPNDSENDDESKHADRDTGFVFGKSKLSSTIWLPANSTGEALLLDDQIDPATDLPPLMDKTVFQDQPYASSVGTQSDSEDELNVINELEVSVSNVEDYDVWDRQERDEEDDKALENLAWELASTVECEGRLTRCESELGDEDGDLSPPQPGEDSEPTEPEPFPLTDLSQVMSEFEFYMDQQAAMEQDSD